MLRGGEVRDALAAADRVAADGDVGVVLAACEGEAVLLGAHQRKASALREASGVVLRRATGGVAIAAGAGTVYAALLLPEPSAIVPCAMDRFLNRHVRGVLKALTKLGAPAQYFGRDVVSVLHRPVAWVGWDRAASGACRMEMVIGVDRSFVLPASMCGYGDRERPAFGGKTGITWVEAAAAMGSTASARELTERLLDRLAEALVSVPTSLVRSVASAGTAGGGRDGPLAVTDWSADDRAQAASRAASFDAVDDVGDREMVWSRPVEDAIGFVEAGVRLRPDGTLARARVAGDYYVERAGIAALEGALAGSPATPEAIGAVLDRALGPGGNVIEGLASLRTLHAALLDAVGRARVR